MADTYDGAVNFEKLVFSKLLSKERKKVTYDAEIAEKFGINAAIILGRIIWSIEGHITKNEIAYFKDGCWWMFDTVEALMSYSKLGRKQIRLVLETLREKNIIKTGQYDHQFGQRRNWFSVNIPTLLTVLSPIVPKGHDSTPIVPKGHDVLSRKGTIDSAERARCIEPKGHDTSLYLESTESLTKNLTERGEQPPPIENFSSIPAKKPKTLKQALALVQSPIPIDSKNLPPKDLDFYVDSYYKEFNPEGTRTDLKLADIRQAMEKANQDHKITPGHFYETARYIRAERTGFMVSKIYEPLRLLDQSLDSKGMPTGETYLEEAFRGLKRLIRVRR